MNNLLVPGARQALPIKRRRTDRTTGKATIKTIHAVTSLTSEQASPTQPVRLIRDRRAHRGPPPPATRPSPRRLPTTDRQRATRDGHLAQPPIGSLKQAGVTNIAAALRRNARDPRRPLALFGLG
ncbi:hypothetical protein OG206_00660 [Streptomyces sp. NBC_01341]|uniref:hypothetical protein n=1 Tax=Streptomyces sp. NBC_01341 TaxID=2903831 RepID=UPI002E162F27|nr:hypothetical protein OG206_00660 [Streptomyces sp. NBC_01341]